MVGVLAVETVETRPSNVSALRFGQLSPSPDLHVELVQQNPATLSCWEALDGRARALLNAAGQLVNCGQSLRRIIGEDRDFRAVSGIIQPIDTRYQARFRRLHQPRTSGLMTEVFPMRHDDGHWICRSSTLEAAAGESLFALTIQRASLEQSSEWIEFRDVFDLTNTESQVLGECLRGLTPQAIADCHHLSINTVRTHFRHIYEKLGVNNMQDLQRKLSGYRLR